MKNLKNCLIVSFAITTFACAPDLSQQLQENNNISVFNNTTSISQKDILKDDATFIEDLSHRSFLYFYENSDSQTGLVLDRAYFNGKPHEPGKFDYNIASSASTGFGLTALCIGSERKWMTTNEARERVRTTLKFLWEKAPTEHGWFLHFMDKQTGARLWDSEYSSIDTALLLGGVLTAKQYFSNDKEISDLATKIYERVDFKWMLRGNPGLLSHGWSPESGFINYRWDTYSEHMILQMLAIGSPTNPVPASEWKAWKREFINYNGHKYLKGGPLFTYQFSHAWVDFRNKKENTPPYTDFFQNSIEATKAHREFCISLGTEFPGYNENIWGITASDSQKGYLAWGGPPREDSIDGTVVPCAAGGSLMFTPELSINALKAMYKQSGDKIYGPYSFVDAYNPNNGWIGPDVIGIDIGITLLSAENSRTGNVWKWFMKNKEIKNAMNIVGLK